MSSMKRELLLYCICRHLKILIEVEFSVTVGVAEVGPVAGEWLQTGLRRGCLKKTTQMC